MSSLCPRAATSLTPMTLISPTRVLANVASGTAAIPIDFEFFLYGRRHIYVSISMHGSLWFGGAYASVPSAFPSNGVAVASITSFPSIIAFGSSFSGVAYAGFVAPEITYSSSIVDGRRALVIRYWGMKYTAYRGLYDMTVSFDVILTEGEPGGIQVRYYTVTPNPILPVTIGLHGPDDFNTYASYVSGEPISAALANQLQGSTLNFTYTGRFTYDACAAFGVNFTSAIARDLTFTDASGITYTANPCGTLRTPSACREGTSVCQVQNGVAQVVSSFNPSSVTWSSSPAPTLGIRSTMRDGTYCAAVSAPRTLHIGQHQTINNQSINQFHYYKFTSHYIVDSF